MNTVLKYSTWKKEDTMDMMIKIITFFISPFLSFLYSLRKINTKSSFLVFFLFALIYGLCFTVISDNVGIYDNSDAANWRFRFENIGLETFSDFKYYCIEYFAFAGADIRDLYFGTVTFIVHQFTDNYHVFFFAIALVSSFFQLGSIRYLANSPSFDNSVICLLLCYLFLANGMTNIANVRYYTAAWMCVYFLFQLFYNNKKIYYVLILILPLIHRSFFFIYPIILLVFFLKDKSYWKSLYFVSIIFSSFSIYIIRDATPYLPSFLSHMLESYTDRTTYEEFSLTKIILSNIAMIYVNVLFILIMNMTKTYLPEKIKPLYQFTLVFLCIVNFVMPVPSLGGRFFMIAQSLIAFLWLNIMGTRCKYNFLIYLMPLFLVRKIYIETGLFLRYHDISFYYTNPFELIYTHL